MEQQKLMEKGGNRLCTSQEKGVKEAENLRL